MRSLYKSIFLFAAIFLSVLNCGAKTFNVGNVDELMEALKYCSGASGHKIIISPGVYEMTSSYSWIVSKNNLVCGSTGNPEDVIIDCKGERKFLQVNGKTNTFSSLTFRNGKGCFFYGDYPEGMVISNCIFTSCISTNADGTANGGAIRLNRAKGTLIIDCLFTNNIADINGAAISIPESYAPEKIVRCKFINNRCNKSGTIETGGGAVYLSKTGSSIIDCYFATNTARYGGACRVVPPASIIGCTFVHNHATSGGGAIRYYKTGTSMVTTLVSRCNFVTNVADSGAPAIMTRSVTAIRMDNCLFENHVTTKTAPIMVRDATNNDKSTIVSMSNCVFRNNRAISPSSAALFAAYTAPEIVSGCSFINNSFDLKNYLINTSGLVENCSFISNGLAQIDNLGSCIYAYSDAKIRNCLFVTNWSNQGLGVCINVTDNKNKCLIDNCTFAYNEQKVSAYSSHYGGMINISSNTTVRNCLFYRNRDPLEKPIAFGVTEASSRPGVSEEKNIFNCFDGEEKSSLTAGVNGNIIGTNIRVKDASSYDFTPRGSSPLRQAGMKLEWMTADSKDIVGNPRISNNATLPDIGAFSYLPYFGLEIRLR